MNYVLLDVMLSLLPLSLYRISLGLIVDCGLPLTEWSFIVKKLTLSDSTLRFLSNLVLKQFLSTLDHLIVVISLWHASVLLHVISFTLAKVTHLFFPVFIGFR